MSKPKIRFPKSPMSRSQIISDLQKRQEADIDWRAGRAFCLIYHPGDERASIIQDAFNQYFSFNALNPAATPSLTQLEAEVVSMTADLLHGDDKVRGSITSGGTESILLAVKSARDWGRANIEGIGKPKVILPESAHPAFMKAFHYFDLDYTLIPCTENERVDVRAMERAIDHNTVMLVGSAPSYPYGVIDPIEEIGQLAKQRGILCHVDACIGGFMLPFLQRLGYPIPKWDFAAEGVTSISADVHKYGYASKGSSVVLYRNAELRKFQFSIYTGWTGGIYGSPTMTGTRPGGTIVGPWAAMKCIGEEGYLEMARSTMETTERLRAGIVAVPELHLVAEPEMTLIAFKSDEIDVYELADELNNKGWHFERQQNPPSLHLTVNFIHTAAIADEFLGDLREAVAKCKKLSIRKVTNSLQVKAVSKLSELLPDGTIAKLQGGSAKGGLKKGNTAAMYGMMGALKGTGDLKTIVLEFMDNINSLEKK
tara:strand:- start:71372 stop:72820 length:1449 start_codon:yes stop_codon:yes gene_type:complete